MISPSEYEYKNALEKVKKYEERQKELKGLNKKLGKLLTQFDDFKFIVNDNRNQDRYDSDSNGNVVFSGIKYSGKLELTQAICKSDNEFEAVIGKLICVHKALGEDFKYLEKYIETKQGYRAIEALNFYVGT